MAKDPVKELRTAIALSKKVPLNYGYCLGIDPWEAVWITHRKKTPATLARQAKKLGNTPKSIYGVMTSELNVITLTCEKPPPGRTAYNAKFYLKEFGLKYKIRLIGPEGEVVDESDNNMVPEGLDEEVDAADLAAFEAKAEADDLDDTPLEEVDEPESNDAPAKAAITWATAKERIAPKVALGRAGPRGADIAKLWTALNARADSGDPAAAIAGLPTLLKLLTVAPTLDPGLVEQFKTLATAAKARVGAAPEQASTLAPLLKSAQQAVKATDNSALATALPPLQAALSRPLPDATTAPEAQASSDPAALAAELRTIWQTARATTDRQLAQLLSSLAKNSTQAGQNISAIGLSKWNAGANADLERALAALASSAPPNLPTAAQETAEAIQTYESFLLMHPAVKLMDKNAQGVPVTLAATLGQALSQMAQRIGQV